MLHMKLTYWWAEISAEAQMGQIWVRRLSLKILTFNLCQNGFGAPKEGYVSYFQTEFAVKLSLIGPAARFST